MFKCKLCAEKDRVIDLLKEQNKDLHDRLMSFNERQFLSYGAEKRSNGPLFPLAVDKDGKQFSYKDVNIKEAETEVYRAFAEEPVTVEEPER